jgi:hypothetical protein
MPYRPRLLLAPVVALIGMLLGAVHGEESNGLRKLTGQHLTLYTDLPSSPEVDELPAVFDAAVEPWRDFFTAPKDALDNWQVVGCLILHQDRFVAAGLFPADLPSFLNGRNVGNKFWLYEQPDPYYRRHLLLHEGTHCVMEELFKGKTPPWYWEGMAELLATHHRTNGKLQLAYFPVGRREVPYLGRIKLVQEDVRKESAKSLVNVLAILPRDFSDNHAYGWSWAAAAFLHNNPRSHDKFLAAKEWIGKPDFNRHLVSEFANDWELLQQEWQVYLANLDYGYDFTRMAIDFTPGKPLSKSAAKVSVRADRGWQSSKLLLEKGTHYEITAQGKFQIAKTDKPWVATAAGVTIRYERGEPLGKLLAGVLPSGEPSSPALAQPIAIGEQGTLTPTSDGTLYLRLNDNAAELADNIGEATVTITPK